MSTLRLYKSGKGNVVFLKREPSHCYINNYSQNNVGDMEPEHKNITQSMASICHGLRCARKIVIMMLTFLNSSLHVRFESATNAQEIPADA